MIFVTQRWKQQHPLHFSLGLSCVNNKQPQIVLNRLRLTHLSPSLGLCASAVSVTQWIHVSDAALPPAPCSTMSPKTVPLNITKLWELCPTLRLHVNTWWVRLQTIACVIPPVPMGPYRQTPEPLQMIVAFPEILILRRCSGASISWILKSRWANLCLSNICGARWHSGWVVSTVASQQQEFDSQVRLCLPQFPPTVQEGSMLRSLGDSELSVTAYVSSIAKDQRPVQVVFPAFVLDTGSLRYKASKRWMDGCFARLQHLLFLLLGLLRSAPHYNSLCLFYCSSRTCWC